MRRIILLFGIALGILVGSTTAGFAADRYWVGGTGPWNATSTANWSTTSGGAGGASVPGVNDNCIFNTSSSVANAAYTVTVMTASPNCFNLSMDGPHPTDVNKVTWAGSTGINIYGSLDLLGGTAGITKSYTGAITFRATTTQTVNMNGLTASAATFFTNGNWTLLSAFNTGSQALAITAGTLNTNGYAVNSTTFAVSSGATINAATSTFTMTSSFSVASGATWSGASSTIVSTLPFLGGGKTYGTTTLTYGSSDVRLTESNTFYNLSLVGTTNASSRAELNANQTVNNVFTVTGNSSVVRFLVRSSVKGATRTITAASTTGKNFDMQDITGAGGASWNFATITGLSGDCGGNTGITFTTATTTYWIGNTGNWSAVAEWGSTSGGAASSGRVPLCQDSAIFDNNSFNSTALTVTQDMVRVGSMDWSAYNEGQTPTFTTSTAAEVNGSFIFNSGVTLTASAQQYTFIGRGNHTIKSSGKTWGKPLVISAPSGTYTLLDPLITTSTLALEAGTFTAGTSSVQATTFTDTGTTTINRTLNMGTSTWTLTSGTANPFTASTSPYMTVNASTSEIILNGVLTADRNFFGGGKTYYNINNLTTGAFSIIINDSNTFNGFYNNSGRGLKFIAGKTNTFNKFVVGGSLGGLTTITTTTAATSTLVITSGIVNARHMSISWSTVTPSTGTWYAGGQSTNGGNNSGWIFSEPKPKTWIKKRVVFKGGGSLIK